MPARRSRLRERISTRRYVGIALGTFASLLAIWWAVTAFGLVDPIFLPSPGAVFLRLGELAGEGTLWSDIKVSVYRITVAYLIASTMAIAIGPLMGMSARIEAALEPLFDFIRYMPVVAFVTLTVIWVGTGDAAKFLLIWMGTFFQQALMMADAVRQVPQPMVHLGETLGMSRTQILLRIVFPAAWPRIYDSLRMTLGWAWTWLVVAELVAASAGLGYRLTVAKRYFATDTIFGYLLILGLLGLLFDQGMRALGRFLFRYQKARS